MVLGSRHQDGFDLAEHAHHFDARAGLSTPVARAVAEAVRALCPGKRLLEIGAGTGEIGAHLGSAEAGFHYVALDRSAAMLARFRERVGTRAQLICGDANAVWPFAPASFDAVWMARVAHLLRPQHLAQQVLSVLRPGGLVLIGRRARDRDNVRAVLRRELRERLRERGYQPREGGSEARHLNACEARLCPLERVEAAAWQIEETPAAALSAWREKPGLSGIDLTEPDKQALLAELTQFALERFGSDLDQSQPGRERFVIDVLRYELA